VSLTAEYPFRRAVSRILYGEGALIFADNLKEFAYTPSPLFPGSWGKTVFPENGELFSVKC